MVPCSFWLPTGFISSSFCTFISLMNLWPAAVWPNWLWVAPSLSSITGEIINLAPMTKYVVFLVRTVFTGPPAGVTIGPVGLLLSDNHRGTICCSFPKNCQQFHKITTKPLNDNVPTISLQTHVSVSLLRSTTNKHTNFNACAIHFFWIILRKEFLFRLKKGVIFLSWKSIYISLFKTREKAKEVFSKMSSQRSFMPQECP